MFRRKFTEMAWILYSVLTYLCTNRANGATHWVVTEDGRIQSQMDSLFNLQRPYDLMAMLRQEDRAGVLENLKQELLTRKQHIDRGAERDTGLEQKFYRTDADCIAAGKPLPEYDLYISTVLPLENKGIRPEEHIDFRAPPVPNPLSPVCTSVAELDFSMEAFEHLEGVRDRLNLTGSPELGLKNAITHRENVDDYGHLVHEALRKNTTSWVLYNMAAFYWRIKGHPYHTVECVRRALHFSPRSYRDVALISLGNVLHRAHYSHEAAIVVSAALEVSRDLNVNHFTLGNIYAVLAEYNKSVICFEDTLKIQPDFEAAEVRRHAVLCHAKLEEALESQHKYGPRAAEVRRHAVLCHAKLEEALESQHKTLQRTLLDLKEYQQKHERWTALTERLRAEQAPSQVRFDQRVGYESHKILRSAQHGVGEYCRMEDKDGRAVLQCSWGRKALSRDGEGWPPRPDKARGGDPSSSSSSLAAVPEVLKYLEPVRAPRFTTKNVLTEEEEAGLPYKDSDWPSKDECDTFVQKFPAWNEFTTTYLSPVNKGFEVKALLSEAQELSPGTQHALPWYPPVCNLVTVPEGHKAYDHILSVQERNKVAQKIADASMKTVLLDMVDGDVTEEEIGQRILTALKKELGPSWLLYNLAGLYWRAIGGSVQGIECLRQALYYAPAEYRDVPLVNLANLLYKLGRVDDAVTLTRDAIQVNDLEPETHFFLGNVLAAKGNITGATRHYELALLQDADHQAAFSSLRTLRCYYKYHRTAQSAAPPPTPRETPGGHSCSQSCTATCGGGGGGNKGKNSAGKGPIESRLICKNDNGRESCVVETSTPHCDHGPCTQTCAISPLSLETCEGPGGIKCLGHNAELQAEPTPDGGMPKCQGSTENCRQPGSLGVMSDTLGPNPMSDPDFYDKMEAIKEYYRHRGLCVGEDCQKYLVQCVTPTKSEGDVESFVAQHFVYQHPSQPPPQGPQCLPPAAQAPRPHTKLEVQGGVLHQKLILVDSPDDIVVGPSDCVIYNDGRKTPGCQREEYRNFQDIEELSRLMSQLQEQETGSHGNHKDSDGNHKDSASATTAKPEPPQAPSTTQKDERSKTDSPPKPATRTTKPSKNTNNSDNKPNTVTKATKDEATTATKDEIPTEDDDEDFIHEEDEESELEDFYWDEADRPTEIVEPRPAPAKSRDDTRDGLLEWAEDTLLAQRPDPQRHISTMTDVAWPSWDECRNNYREINFRRFSSTWASITTKDVSIGEVLDLTSPVYALHPPVCTPHTPLPVALDALPSVHRLATLGYRAETGLRDVLTSLSDTGTGGGAEGVGEVGARIASTLSKDPRSWAANNLAALYWRVEGDARRAMDCVKVAYQEAPLYAKDIALLSLANILHSVGALEEAVIVCDLALQSDATLVATHFSLANIYAAREEWTRARKFYESTLGLQGSFYPAAERLYTLRCNKVLSNPHLYGSDGRKPARTP